MECILSTATIIFEPDPSWMWQGWNGELKLQPSETGIRAMDTSIAVKPDILALQLKLLGKQYKARGFEDIAGVVGSAMIMFDESSLSNVATINGLQVAHAGTKGTFTVNVAPSFVNGSPPIPDPILLKTGSWRIKTPGQKLVTSS